MNRTLPEAIRLRVSLPEDEPDTIGTGAWVVRCEVCRSSVWFATDGKGHAVEVLGRGQDHECPGNLLSSRREVCP